ncbi:MAG TPA: hypothetical protein PLF13_00415 [candidate division Zixibacteria bacterium]|nr:hypothetical protein [candidate division Zixibacteria bacterium]
MPKAARLAAAFERAFGIKSEYIKGGGGILQITLDGEIIYSNKIAKYGPEPTDDQAIAILAEATGLKPRDSSAPGDEEGEVPACRLPRKK